jgi:amidase
MGSVARRFLGLAIILALLLVASAVAAPIGLAHGSGGGGGHGSTRLKGIDIDRTTIPELQRLMDRGKLSSEQLVRFYLKRIDKVDDRLNSIITVSPTALDEARAADKARRNGDDRPLLGIPILVKDNINTTGMPTTAGSWALEGSTPSDAFIVQQLRAAGAIIIGKANLSEWANFRSNPSSSGWSGIGGQTNSPYVLDRNPCGSSSGSGVAVAADLAVAAVGTETDGSIVCPSGANSVVGIKPSLGLLSRTGIIPISADQDTAGPMTRNVTDAAVLLGAMTGLDPADPATVAGSANAFVDYTQFLDKRALRGANIGVWREGVDVFDGVAVDEDVDEIMEDVIDELEDQGATVTEITLDLTDVYGPEFEALLCEFKTDIATYLETYTDPPYPQNLTDLIAFHEADPRENIWNSQIFIDADATGGRSDPACVAARAAATPVVQERLNALLEEYDAIVAATNGPPWVTDPVNGDLGGDFSTFIGSSSASAISGYANITVPAGYVDRHLPIGISFIGGLWDEPDLIGYAYDFERAQHARKPPSFKRTIH